MWMMTHSLLPPTHPTHSHTHTRHTHRRLSLQITTTGDFYIEDILTITVDDCTVRGGGGSYRGLYIHGNLLHIFDLSP